MRIALSAARIAVYAVLAIATPLTGIAAAQAPTATLVGLVTDPTKAVVPGATR